MDAIAIWNFSNYRKDIDAGAGFHFHSNQSRLHTALNIGDTLGLVTRIVENGRNEYRLAARLVIRSKTINAPSYQYGSCSVSAARHNETASAISMPPNSCCPPGSQCQP